MNPPTPPSTPERPLSATRLVQYVIVRGRCERYLRLALFPSEGQALMHRYGVTPEALSPILAETGSVFEPAAMTQLAVQASVTDLRHRSAQELYRYHTVPASGAWALLPGDAERAYRCRGL